MYSSVSFFSPLGIMFIEFTCIDKYGSGSFIFIAVNYTTIYLSTFT